MDRDVIIAMVREREVERDRASSAVRIPVLGDDRPDSDTDILIEMDTQSAIKRST